MTNKTKKTHQSHRTLSSPAARRLVSRPARLAMVPPTRSPCTRAKLHLPSLGFPLRAFCQSLTCRFSLPWAKLPPPATATAAAPREGIAAIFAHAAELLYSTTRVGFQADGKEARRGSLALSPATHLHRRPRFADGAVSNMKCGNTPHAS